MKNKAVFLFLFYALFVGICYTLNQYEVIPTGKTKVKNKVAPEKIMVIDAGHGGMDPGKVGVNNVLEKDINLSIAKKLKGLMEKKGVKVILTRDSDKGLYNSSDTHKKSADLQRRTNLITESKADLVVSIHQNSFTSPEIKGAQVFFYEDSPESETLAQCVQDSLRANIDPENKREIKPNASYYLLKKNPCPMVIVECGFLSNPEEAAQLSTEEYQNKIAAAIRKGIMEYWKQKKDQDSSTEEDISGEEKQSPEEEPAMTRYTERGVIQRICQTSGCSS